MTNRLTILLFLLFILTHSSIAQRVDTIYSSDFVKVVGDTSIKDDKIESVLIRFQPFITFKDFKVKVYKGPTTAINYKSNVTAREFRTRITDTYESEGCNFAGHFCFVFWGCGSACQSSAIVDVTSGKVYDGPSASHGYDFKISSRMIIINPPEKTGFVYDNCPGCHPEIWLWNDKTKTFEQKEADEG